MDRAALLQLLEDVGREMVRLEMDGHVPRARRAYAAIRAGTTPEWNEALIVEWARLLRVPPHHEHYEIRDRSVKCSRARASDRHAVYTATVFPGGHLMRCHCDEEWLVLDGIGTPEWKRKHGVR